MSLAESTGLIVPIGQWVLGQALRQVGHWRQTRPGVTVSVNVSARQLADPGLAAGLATAIRDSGADPGVLSLEVTEDTVEKDPELAARMLEAFSQLGVQVTMDDFGTGHSSLQGLRRLPLKEIKIDPSFVSGLGASPDDAALLGAMVDLGHALGVTVTAEGVETDTQLAHLRDLGCDGAQGYLFSRPVPEDGVHALLGAEPQG